MHLIMVKKINEARGNPAKMSEVHHEYLHNKPEECSHSN